MRWAIAGLLFAADVRANSAPIFPFMKNAPAVYRIETDQEFPDLVLVVFEDGYDPKVAEFVELTPTQPFIVRVYPEKQIDIVPRSKIRAGATAIEAASSQSRNWLHANAPVPSWYKGEVPVTYRVQRSQNRDGWELVQTSRSPLWQWKLAAGFLAFAILQCGLLFVRWMLRTQPRATN